MSYRCPLCLKQLNEQQQLTRYCTLHPELGETFNCYPHLIPFKMFCPKLSCESVSQIEEGVFLRHEHCEERNPFWNGTTVEIPGEPHESQVVFTLDFGTGRDQQVKVQYWMLGALRKVPQNNPEMWFPLMLLRATGERNGSSRVGSFIELAGARAGGKTILAVQAMNPHGYAGCFVDLDSFIFSRREGSFDGASFRRYIETLHLSSLLYHGNQELFLLEGTPPGPRNLRVAFIKPADNHGVPFADGDRNVKGHFRRIGKIGIRYLKRFFKEDVRASFAELTGSQGYRPYWHTIAFYDKSGEAEELEHVMPDTLDKVAVVINAVEIFREKPKDMSIGVAVQRIRKAAERKQVCYLVITQLDRVRQEIGESDWQVVTQLADGLSEIGRDRGALRKTFTKFFPARPSATRLLLEKWLQGKPGGNRWQLKERLQDVEEIFFVWTEHLPASNEIKFQQILPSSHGLARLVCRCLDIKWEQIYRGDRS